MDNQTPQQGVPTSYQQPNVPQPVQPQVQTQLGVFERRMGRLAFLLGLIYALAPLIILVLILFVVRFALASNNGAITSLNALSAIVNIISLLVGIVSVIIIIPLYIFSYTSSHVRRLHDVNLSGWLTLLVFVPFVNLLLFLYLLFAPGTEGPNKYGNPVNSYNYWVVLGLKKPQA